MKALLISDIPLESENRNGPSSLLNEIFIFLIESGYDVDLLEFNSCNFEYLDNYDRVIAYPSRVMKKIPLSSWHRITIVGPDNTFLLFWRLFLNSNSGYVYRFKSILAIIYCFLFELFLTAFSREYYLVGKHDVRLIKFFFPKWKDKVKYLPHPFNSSYKKNKNDSTQPLNRIVLFGDLSKKYSLKSTEIAKIINLFAPKEISVLIVGAKNRWLYTELKEIIRNDLVLSYEFWVDNFESISRPGADIHLFPIAAGAGTKNRVLNSIQMGVSSVGTNFAYENIADTEFDRSKLGLFLIDDIVLPFEPIQPDPVFVNNYISSVSRDFRKILLVN